MMRNRLQHPVLKSPDEIRKLRNAGRLVGKILHEMRRMAAPGMTTYEMGQRAHEMIREAGAQPLFLNYPNPSGSRYPAFPSVICASVNEAVVHGIPDKRKLVSGDIVSIDCGVRVDGYVGDSAVTIPIGEVSNQVQKLLDTTEECLARAIDQCQPGNRLGDIGHVVQKHAESRGYGVVRDYCGHGIGRQMHEEPQVPNYGNAGTGQRLKAGLCIAIEPMINLGTWKVETLEDAWTVVTADRKPSAHFEHSIAITSDGPVVLTAWDPDEEE